jgi:hypothetical protein
MINRLAAYPHGLLLALIIFGMALPPRLLNLDVFIGPDEFSWVERSANFAQALAAGDLAETYQTGHPGVTLLWSETIGSWLRFGLTNHWPTALAADKTMTNLAFKRQIVTVVNALIVAGCAVLVNQIFGRCAAWMAGILLAFDPFLLTESRALRTEGLVTGFGALALLSSLVYLKSPQPRFSLLVGVLTGLALLSKVSAIILLPLSLLVIGGGPFLHKYNPLEKFLPRLGDWGMKNKEKNPLNRLNFRISTAAKLLLIWGTALAVTVLILWPALWVEPLEVTQKMYDYVTLRAVEGEGGGSGTFFGGAPVAYQDLDITFYPIALLYRTGPWVWLGLILLLILVWPLRNKGTRKSTPENLFSPYHLLSIGIIILYPGLYLILVTCAELKFDRYLIPILPGLDVLAALGLAAGWQQGVTVAPRLQRWGWLAALLVLLGQLALIIPHHPYYYTFWNPLLGGLSQAVKVLPVGEGEGIDQVATYLNTRPDVAHLKLALANSQKIGPVFKGQTIPLDNLDGKWVQADYVMIYISQLQRGKHAEDILAYLARHQPEYTLILHGLEYAWLYPGPAAQFYGGGHKLEGRGTLFGYSFRPLPDKLGAGGEVEIAAGETLPVTLYWRNEGQLESDRFFVRLMDLDGYIWAEAIAQPRHGFEEVGQVENQIVESEVQLTLPVGLPPGDYFFKPGFHTAGGELIGYFELPDDTKPIRVTAAKTYPTLFDFRPPRPARLAANDELELLGYKLDPDQTAPGSPVWATLYWGARADVTHDYIILLRLVDEAGVELAYWLGRPVRSGYPTPQWQAGQIVQDPWRLNLAPTTQPGDYQLEIAIFDAATEKEIIRQKLGRLIVKSELSGPD